MAYRPRTTVYGTDKQILVPAVFTAPIRDDIVHFVHSSIAKNRRQPYAVSREAGHQHSAHSWGTGRAVSRIPRVSGGGTHRAGQGAFGNMCRKGRMFAPTKIYRKWHRKVNRNQRRYAVVSALAATALPALVMSRGHRISQVEEVPLVIPNEYEGISKTKEAVKILKSIGAYEDCQKAKDSKHLRSGKGKMRNRRYVMRRGPLVVYNSDNGITRAFRNLPGVELCQVDALNLLQLAPGGHLGRFIVWTEAAFMRLDDIFGTVKKESKTKKGFKIPRNVMTNSDLARLINSDEIQSIVRPTSERAKRAKRKRNPYRNAAVMERVNPYVVAIRDQEKNAKGKDGAACKKLKVDRKQYKKASKEFFKNVIADKGFE